MRRAANPEATDENLAEEEATEGRLLGDRAVGISPEVEERVDDEDAMLYGTTDVGRAIEEGTAWIPPEAPTPEGVPGEDERGEFGEDH